jgi:hypothetical protein
MAGAFDSRSFTLEVLNINDPPIISTEDVLTANEDALYQIYYKAVDIDPTMDVFEWSLRTNSGFLTIDAETGLLSGTPTQDDVGEWWVNVSVSDGNGGFDWSNFTLTVLNVNDPPLIVEARYNSELFDPLVDLLRFGEGRGDIFWVRATDEDGDELEYRWVYDSRVVARGNELRYGDLEDGFYPNLTLEVDDGTTTTDFRILKTWVTGEDKEVGGSMLWLFLLVLAVIIGLIVVYVLRSQAKGDTGPSD